MDILALIGVIFVILLIYAIVMTFKTQISFILSVIVIGFCAYGAFKALKNYAAAFKKNTIDSNRS